MSCKSIHTLSDLTLCVNNNIQHLHLKELKLENKMSHVHK